MTAQGIEAATADKTRSGLAEGESPVHQDAPNPLYQQGYSMIDTTDQQAVTVAQEDRDAACETYLRFRYGQPPLYTNIAAGRIDHDPIVQHFARHRLASVSSASAEAEALAGYRAAVSWISADSWDGCSDCIEILKAARAADSSNTQSADPDATARELARIRLHRPALAASPEPIPATNQAGEVATAVELLEQYAGFIRRDVKADDLERHPYLPLIEQTIAALATQPATSPMKMAVDRDWLTAKIAADPDAECDAGVMHPEAPQPATSQEGDRDARLAHAKAWLCKRWSQEHPNAQHVIQLADYAEALASTPTPPTLSEDLREGGARKVLADARIAAGSLFGDCPDDVAISAMLTFAALAQVKAS